MGSYADPGNDKYRNPILFADYSDPDVIRVGDTFYLTASSFNYTPGLPILTSKDLVNWTLVNYALDNIPEKRYGIPRHSEGVWAPSIRFHDGMFYIYYGMPDEGIYVVRTKDPLGKWEEPVCVLEGKGLIDSCPFWDEDGKAYIIHGYAKSRIGFKSILGIFEMSPDGLRAISEDHFIFDGNDPKHPAVTIEGPKVYKRDGYYYILAPAGGVKFGYQVALRSKNIHGPYEIKEVMHTGNTVINGPHQGGLVDTDKGQEWFIHFQDRGFYGRICHLQPVDWKDGWPVIGVNPDENGCGEPVYEYKKPAVNNSTEAIKNHGKEDIPKDGNDSGSGLTSTDHFKDGEPDLCWQWLGNHKDIFCGRTENKDGIRLYALNVSGENSPIIWKSANVLTQKLIYPTFTTDISLDIAGLRSGERAGICMMGGQYITAYVKNEDSKFSVVVAESEGGDRDKKEVIKSETSLDVILPERDTRITFRMEFSLDGIKADKKELYFANVSNPAAGRNPSLKISIGQDKGEGEQKFYDLGTNYTPSDHTWVGAKIGIYAFGEDENSSNSGYADFKSVVTREI